MSPYINLLKIGFRKDGGKGSVWGYFTEIGKPETPRDLNTWYPPEYKNPVCHVFRGKIGKTLYIEECDFTSDFVEFYSDKVKNYKFFEPNQISHRWCKSFDNEIDMYITILKLRG